MADAGGKRERKSPEPYHLHRPLSVGGKPADAGREEEGEEGGVVGLLIAFFPRHRKTGKTLSKGYYEAQERGGRGRRKNTPLPSTAGTSLLA